MKTLGSIAKATMMTLSVALAMPAPVLAQAAQAAPASAAAPAPAKSTDASYTLGTGDKLRITVFGETGLTGEYAVSTTGMVSFPLIGDIPAANRTLGQVQEAIRVRLAAGYIKDPRVAIEVLEYRTFYILGEVQKPGEYAYRNNLTLEQAVATAGGYTYRANRKRFVIAHDGGNESREKFKDVGQLHIQPGDTIRILERFF